MEPTRESARDSKNDHYGRVSTDATEVKRTTAVWMHPDGVTPVGALDNAGNVWEMCGNDIGRPLRVEMRGNAFRVVRGGGWGSNAGDCRSADRYNLGPGDRYGLLGFRLSRSLGP